MLDQYASTGYAGRSSSGGGEDWYPSQYDAEAGGETGSGDVCDEDMAAELDLEAEEEVCVCV